MCALRHHQRHRPYAIAMARKRVFAILPLIIMSMHLVSLSSAESEADILLKFKESLVNSGGLSSWNNSNPPCNGDVANWFGVFCDKGTVWGLQLYNMGLKGIIDVDSLAKLPNLRTMSFMNNEFDGPLPNFARAASIKTLYLSNNKFSGEIPENAFVGMLALKKLHLANNQFSGDIPASLVLLPKLMELMLENNRFEGPILQFPEGRMKNFNVSNNMLAGEIPPSLSHLSASSFEGNRDLCGAPLELCASAQPLSLGTIIVLPILVAATFGALVAGCVILHRRKQTPEQPEAAAAAAPAHTDADLDRMEQGQVAPASTLSPKKSRHSGKRSEPNVKITFLREDRDRFDMKDLLKASAEILGSGVFGSTYKAALSGGQVVVVKRFRQMNNVNKQEFHEHMRRMGRLSHPNVLPIIGFYYRKEEKLLVTDYVQKASLASHLHGNRSRNDHICPDWPTRLNIVKGVAKGLLYLHNELPSLTAPHGHLKSSNVLLDGSCTPILTDYGLVPVVNQEHAQQHMISYKCPEYRRSSRITKKTDVWSLGILILETLTGRLPSSFLQQGKGGSDSSDAEAWAESVMRDEEDDEDVFDVDMARNKESEGEMMKLLKVGFDCCQVDVDVRPDIREAVHRIEGVKERES